MEIEMTQHPRWVAEFLRRIEPFEQKITCHPYFEQMAAGTLSIKRFRGGLLNFYPMIENFPKYMELIATKLEAEKNDSGEKTRDWLLDNISVERQHAEWWKNWAVAFGVPSSRLRGEVSPPAEMDAINIYLWRICTHGSFVEAIAAVNFAIEGPTGAWTRKVCRSLTKYENIPGVTINSKTTQWVREHAAYDDRHPGEALEIIKWFASTANDRQKATRSAIRSMEYYSLALDACYEIFE